MRILWCASDSRFACSALPAVRRLLVPPRDRHPIPIETVSFSLKGPSGFGLGLRWGMKECGTDWGRTTGGGVEGKRRR